jgi:hypothetical protein
MTIVRVPSNRLKRRKRESPSQPHANKEDGAEVKIGNE